MTALSPSQTWKKPKCLFFCDNNANGALHMGQTDRILGKYSTRLYSSTKKEERYLHIVRLLQFTDNSNQPVFTDENSDRLQKMRNLFEILKKMFTKFYSPSEHLAVDEVIVLFKGRVIFRQYIPQKHLHFGIKIYKIRDETGYMYDMTVYSILIDTDSTQERLVCLSLWWLHSQNVCVCMCVVGWCFWHYHAKAQLQKFWGWNFLCKNGAWNSNISKINWKL
jgi:hypothetical protein